MEAQYQLSTGLLECFSTHAIFHFTGQRYDLPEALEFTKVVDLHYRNRKCVVISNRTITKKINPEVYTTYVSKSVVVVAIVSMSDDVREEAVAEQSLYNGAFTFFHSLEDAVRWGETVVKKVSLLAFRR
ncbi:MAG: hypothetical protein OQJ83_03145 [Altibacter sp.]|nr:hypothetical protein [Altibacter sp.]